MKTIIIIFLIALTIECRSQIIQEGTFVQQVWKAEYSGTGNSSDVLESVVTDNAGNVYVTGRIIEPETGEDWATIKYNSAGERLWVTKFSGNHTDIPRSIVVDNAGNVYVAGESDYLSSDYYTVKYNSAGVEQWAKRYGGNGKDIAYCIALDEDGNVYVTGSDMNGNGHLDCVTLKYSPGGNLVWERRYDGPDNEHDAGTSVAVGSDGSIYVAGRSEYSETGNDVLLIKYNSSGTQQWVKTYDGPGHGSDVVREMVLGYNSAIYLTGYSAGETTGNDYLTLKYNTGGYVQWVKRYNGPANNEDRGTSLVVDDLGNSYVTGYSESNATSYDFVTIKYGITGNMQWVKREDGGNNYLDYSRDIALDESGDIYVTGVFKKTDEDFQLATIKYNSSGDQKWIKKFTNPAGKNSEAWSIAVDRSENILVGGTSDVQNSNLGNFLVVKYTQSPYIILNRIEMPNTFSLSQNYPNPFNPVTNIEFSIPKSANIKLTVFDITGREVARLVNQQLEAGTYNVDFDASHLATGTYLYRLEAGEFTEVKKMILIK